MLWSPKTCNCFLPIANPCLVWAGGHIPESHRFQHYINYSYAYSHRHCLTPWKLRRLLTRGGEVLTSLDQTEIASFRAVLDSYALNCLHRTDKPTSLIEDSFNKVIN